MPCSTKEAQVEYQRKWMAARRASYFSDKRCSECGSDIDLELDHIDPSMKVSHRIWSWSEEKRSAELAKCQVLCVECHRKKTDTYYDPMREHGTSNRWNRGCRCWKCRRASADRKSAWRKRTGRH